MSVDRPPSVPPPGIHPERTLWLLSIAHAVNHAQAVVLPLIFLRIIDEFGVGVQAVTFVAAAGAILHYLRDTQRAALEHLDRPTHYDRSDCMSLDSVTVRNLELVESLLLRADEVIQ